MESPTQVQILDEVVCVSLRANALGKGMNRWKAIDRLGYLALVRQPAKENEKSEFRPVLPRLKVDLVTSYSCWGQMGWYILVKDFRMAGTKRYKVILMAYGPVGWSYRIHWLLICIGLRLPPPRSVLPQCWSFGECWVPLYWHSSQVYSDPEW